MRITSVSTVGRHCQCYVHSETKDKLSNDVNGLELFPYPQQSTSRQTRRSYEMRNLETISVKEERNRSFVAMRLWKLRILLSPQLNKEKRSDCFRLYLHPFKYKRNLLFQGKRINSSHDQKEWKHDWMILTTCQNPIGWSAQWWNPIGWSNQMAESCWLIWLAIKMMPELHTHYKWSTF